MHYTPAHFQAYLDRSEPDGDEPDLVRHLEACEACREQLADAAGTGEWWREAQHFLSREELDQNDEATLPAAETGIELDFLGPTDDPAMLGRIGLYEVTGVIGRGGTGIVLKAFDRTLHRFVAIKVLSPHLAASAAARKRFAREGQAIAAVAHDHIVPIYAVDEYQGLPYLVMRYVPGMSLQQRIDREGPLALREILRIGVQTAQGLAAAHAQGLVHRDVKPANILLENGIERVMLTDFGLARTVDDASLTCSGIIAGTPQYMAPEQARGEAIDHRTDLFSLGSVLYCLCTGHSPFRAETTMGILHRICKTTPRPIGQLNPEIPRWLCDVIAMLHAKQPARRMQTAIEVAELLERRLAQLQQPTTQPLLARVAAWCRDVWTLRRRSVVLAGTIVAAALIGVAVWSSGVFDQTPVEKPSPAAGAVATSDDTPRIEPQVETPRPRPTPLFIREPADWDATRPQLESLQRDVQRIEYFWVKPTADEPLEFDADVQTLRQSIQVLERDLPPGDTPAATSR